MAESTPFRLPRFRFTLLDECGNYDTGSCATMATRGTVEIGLAKVGTDRTALPVVNADSEVLAVESDAPQLHWYTVTLKLTGIDPVYFSWISGQTILYNDAAAPEPIGLASGANSARLGNCAFEGWTRLAGTACSSGVPQYGYILLPWLREGEFTDITFASGLTECMLTARTSIASPWGTGPYSVAVSEAVATAGEPWPLFTAVGDEDHRIWMITKLAPPAVTTDCGPVVPTLAVVDDDGAGVGLDATATLPTGSGTAPGYIDWGDGGAAVYVASGPTAAHTYGAAGPYTVTWRPTTYSAPVYTGDVTMA